MLGQYPKREAAGTSMSQAVQANDRSARETGTLPTGSASHTAAMALLICVAYFVAAKIGLALTLHPHPVSTLWPPNALLLALLLLTPIRSWLDRASCRVARPSRRGATVRPAR